MAAVGRATAALLSGSQEITLALANLNFDFSLVKVDAPAEYRGVGDSLTKHRLDAAETGSSHITARKLGALFEHTVPNTPHLLEAYGSRASTIVKPPDEGTKGPKKGGIFSNYVGADATSIWAAATSGRRAISVHLLACMLARVWTAPEATSIWFEIVQARKHELQQIVQEETFSFAVALAGNVTLTREQLAEWDNSARAWLRHADRVRSTEQNQVMLILSNLEGLAVSPIPSTYKSVMDAWVTALQGMESLLNGTSQGISSGGLLLALSSWHLYPDMIALGSTSIIQRDPLFPKGTTVTLNLQSNSSTKTSGVYWSLSLSHMKFYGAPIDARGAYAMESSRITFEHLQQIILGSVCNSWGMDGSDAVAVARLLCSISSKCHEIKNGSLPWLDMLADASDTFLSSKDESRTLYRKLITLGRKRGSAMLARTDNHPPPVFGLTNLKRMMRLVTPEYRIGILRAHARRYFSQADPFDVILRYRTSRAQRPPHSAELALQDPQRLSITSQDEFAGNSKFPSQNSASEANVTREDKAASPGNVPSKEAGIPSIDITPAMMHQNLDLDANAANAANPYANFVYATLNPYELLSFYAEPILYHWIAPETKAGGLGEEALGARLIYKAKSEAMTGLDTLTDEWSVPESFFRSSATSLQPGGSEMTYKFLFGDPHEAALFVESSEYDKCQKESGGPNWGRTRPPIKHTCGLADLQAALEAGAVNVKEMLEEIISVIKGSVYFHSLSALAAARSVYKNLEGATISPNVVAKPIYDARWAKGIKDKTLTNLQNNTALDRLETLACITYFESEGLDLAPSQFTNVMALSSGDSIYVAAWLICDPAERQPPNAVRRLHGNVGKAGLTLLVPPADPQVLAPEIDNWKLIDRKEFDGIVTNTFTGTSLHLSFTDWCIPIEVGEARRGRRDADACIIESLVSVYDRGRWIGDLDVLGALSKGSANPDHAFFYRTSCAHVDSKAIQPHQVSPSFVTIENWDEFLEHPESPAVAMAHGNWDAKLALAVLGVRRGDRVFVMEKICENCFADLEDIGGSEKVAKILVIP